MTLFLCIAILLFWRVVGVRGDFVKRADYSLAPRVVMGGGGLMGATEGSHLHFATLGEGVVGGSQNSVHFLFTGFWQSGAPLFTSTDEAEAANIPGAFKLYQNYPNPFNPQTMISYDAAQRSEIIIEIFNLMGQRVRLLVEENQDAGSKSITWDGRDDLGRPLGAGVYICRLTAVKSDGSDSANFQQQIKMLLVK